MTIKKAFVELVEFLEANENKKVSTIMDTVRAMCEGKVQANTSIKDKDGNVVAIFCYYHKQWELVSETEYGKKASSATGLNTMCKVGTSLWTKQQRDARKASADILAKVAKGDVSINDIADLQNSIEADRVVIDTTNMPIGYTAEEIEARFAN